MSLQTNPQSKENALESSWGLLLANFIQTGLWQTLPQGSSVFPSAHVSFLLRSDAIFECEWCKLVGRETGINQQPLHWSSSSFQSVAESCLRARRGKWAQRPALGTAEVIKAWGNGCSQQQRGIRFAGYPRTLGIVLPIIAHDRIDKAPQKKHQAAISRCRSKMSAVSD